MKRFLALSILAISLLWTGCSSSVDAPSNVAARVNGTDITIEELEKQFTSRIQGADPVPSDEEIDDLKLQLLSELVNNQILLQKADEAMLTATDAEVDERARPTSLLNLKYPSVKVRSKIFLTRIKKVLTFLRVFVLPIFL